MTAPRLLLLYALCVALVVAVVDPNPLPGDELEVDTTTTQTRELTAGELLGAVYVVGVQDGTIGHSCTENLWSDLEKAREKGWIE